VSKAQLSVTTAIHDADHNVVTSVLADSIVHDTAAVTGEVGGFTLPAVSFTFFPNSDCTVGTGSPIPNDPTPAPDTLASIDTAALAAGSYAFQATVAGDSNYIGATSACEPLTVVPQTGMLLPTAWTCLMYKNASNPDAMYPYFEYQVDKAGLINSISPGVFFYYNTITAPASGDISVVETNTSFWKPMLVQDLRQAILYNFADCSKSGITGVASYSGVNDSIYTVTFTGATPGAQYIIGIKYSHRNLIGQSPTPATNTYFFSTYFGLVPQVGSGDSIGIQPKP
jgi:hypothetical protein